jgi:8-hydroxy-5-deazaflavin:NADPH oxidoreductase
MNRRTVLTALGAAAAASAALPARAAQTKEKIAMIGTGHLGQVLAKGWFRAGHRIVYGSRTPHDDRVNKIVNDTGPGTTAATVKDAVAQAAIVVLALPWKGAKELLPVMGDLEGKIVLDPINSGKIVNGYVAPDEEIATSIGEQLQLLLPLAKVVKAFNTPAASNVVDPNRAGGHVSIPLAGEDADAKLRVAELVTELGVEPIDTGPMIAARYLEAMERLSFGYFLYQKRERSFEFHLAPVRR